MTDHLRSGSMAFRPRARLLRLLGEELISDEVVAVAELVKNAHDADASAVTISFRGVTGDDGKIVVADDGCGMDLETVLGVWMEPGATSKGTAGRRLTSRGRRVLGEKGVGRFAADKLARHLELISRRAGESTEVRALFDWDRFDADSPMLTEVRSRWEVLPARTISDHGTVLRMSALRSRWTERMFRRLCTRLSRLRSPFRELDGFVIRIESDEFPEYSGELRADFLDRAPYRIDAVFDGATAVKVTMNGGKTNAQEWTGTEALTCGPVHARIFAFDLETEAIARIGPRMEVRAWLREWCGISIYRDGFRIWPYGEPDDDWLRLDQRRVNNPVVRLSNNQVVGFVEISREANPALRDQTNREGLLHDRALEDLRRFLHFVLQLLEAERQAVRHPAAHDGGTAAAVRNGHGPVLERRAVEGYSELAAAAQAAALLSLTITPLVQQMRTHVAALRQSLNGTGDRAILRNLDALATSIAQQAALLTFTGREVRSSRRTIDVVAELERSRQALRLLLDALGIKMSIRAARGKLLRTEMRPETFHHLTCILVKNAIEWIREVRGPRIVVVASARGDHVELLFSDNGPGIPAGMVPRVFEPSFSAKEGARGMGLTVARSLVELNRGQIDVVTDRERAGMTVRIRLPRKRSRATPGRPLSVTVSDSTRRLTR